MNLVKKIAVSDSDLSQTSHWLSMTWSNHTR